MSQAVSLSQLLCLSLFESVRDKENERETADCDQAVPRQPKAASAHQVDMLMTNVNFSGDELCLETVNSFHAV